MDFERPNARMVYRLFNDTLRPTLKAAGYKRSSGTQGAWAKALDEGFLVVAVHASPWGWDEFTGITVEFGLQWSPTAFPLSLDDSGRPIPAVQAYGGRSSA